MLNDFIDRSSTNVSSCIDSSRFIASGLPAGQETKGAGRLSHPALLYSHSTALESLLSVALSSVEYLDFITSLHLEKVGSFSLLIWAHFQN
jgi:hypothetical protein